MENFLKNQEFVNKLKTEYLNEVFVWLCLGANNYYKSGGKIIIPKSLEDAKNDYMNEIDTTNQFIDDKCVKKQDTKTKLTELYEQYKNYCMENGNAYTKNTDFYKRLESLGFVLCKVKSCGYVKDLEIDNNLFNN